MKKAHKKWNQTEPNISASASINIYGCLLLLQASNTVSRNFKNKVLSHQTKMFSKEIN